MIISHTSNLRSQIDILNLKTFQILVVVLSFAIFLLTSASVLAAEKCFVCNNKEWRLLSGDGSCPAGKELPACQTDDKNAFEGCRGDETIAGQTCESAPKEQPKASAQPVESLDEKAVQSLNIQLPDTVRRVTPEPKSLFQKFLQSLSTLLGFKVGFPELFSPRSNVQNQAETPDTLHPNPSASPDTKLKVNVTEVYDNSLPFKDDELNTPCKAEVAYQISNFPKGVKPVTNCTGQ